VGIWLDDGLTLWVGVTVMVVVWVGVTVVVVVWPGVVVSVEVDVVPPLADPLPEAAGWVVMLKVFRGGVEVPPDVQAETVAVPSKAKAPQPAAVSLACNAVLPIAVRTFIEPPHAPFPRPRQQKTGTGKKRAAGPIVCPRQPKTAAADRIAKAHGRRKHAMARPPFKY